MPTQAELAAQRLAAAGTMVIPVLEFPRLPGIVKGSKPDVRKAWDEWEKKVDSWRKALMPSVSTSTTPFIAPPTATAPVPVAPTAPSITQSVSVVQGAGIAVNGVSGGYVVSLNATTTLVPEPPSGAVNLYFTAARARSSISVTSPLAYDTVSGGISIPAASASASGYLTSSDWSLFNSKFGADGGTFTGIVTFSALVNVNGGMAFNSLGDGYLKTVSGTVTSAFPTTTEVSEGTNLYYTDVRADTRIALAVASYLPLAGGTMTGALSFSGTAHVGVVLNNLTVAQASALTPVNGSLVMVSDGGYLAFYEQGADAWLRLIDSDDVTPFAETLLAQSSASSARSTLGVPAISGDTMTGLLQFSGTTHGGIRLNNLTTVQRDAISSPADGLLIFNSTTGGLNFRTPGAWVVLTALTSISATSPVTYNSSTGVIGINAASANTASYVVQRDASGNFSAGTITASLTGAASSNVLKAGDTMTGLLQFSGTGHAGVKLNSLTTSQRDALTPSAGMILVNSSLAELQWYDGSAWRGMDTAPLFVATDDSGTVQNTTTETTLVPAGAGTTTFAADSLVEGDCYKVEAWGYYSTHSAPGTVTFRLRLDSTSGTTLAATGATTPTANRVNSLWRAEFVFVVRTDGGAGEFMTQGAMILSTSTTAHVQWPAVSTAVINVSTTISHSIMLTVQWATASLNNAITCTNFTIKKM